jgi:hypothetical protein
VSAAVGAGSVGAFEGEADRAASDVAVVISDSGLENSGISEHSHAEEVVSRIKCLRENPDGLARICEEGEAIRQNAFGKRRCHEGDLVHRKSSGLGLIIEVVVQVIRETKAPSIDGMVVGLDSVVTVEELEFSR